MKKSLMLLVLFIPCLLLAGREKNLVPPASDTGKLIRYNLADTLLKIPARMKEIVSTASGKSKSVSPVRYLLRTTGKDNGLQTARWMAAAMKKNLLQVDLSLLVSKYIGETEKNLSRLFDRAEAAGYLLFFDEADALFGKRTAVTESHDRYANQEVSYLIQRLEKYTGVVLIACSGEDCLKNLSVKNSKQISW